MPAGPAELARTEAVNLALDPAAVIDPATTRRLEGDPATTRRIGPDSALLGPAPGAALRRNPLYADGTRRWPQERWAAEYGPRASGYLPQRWLDLPADSGVRRRLLLDLPETW
jgi:hypothetical protein